MLQFPIQLPPLSLSPKQRLSPQLQHPLPHYQLRQQQYDHQQQQQQLLAHTPPSEISSPASSYSSSPSPASQSSSGSSSPLAEVLQQGDIVAPGALLQGEPIHLLSIPSAFDPSFSTTAEDAAQDTSPIRELEVVRRLGTGSYAVVYLVRELLERPDADNSSEDGLLGPIDLDTPLAGIEHGRLANKTAKRYGKEYAIKCLSKANLDEEALYAQLSEVSIHQSLREHPNIVTLHRTMGTASFLLLLLEYVPGQDLFYFLEQSRDTDAVLDTTTAAAHGNDYLDSSVSPTNNGSSEKSTPPTPSLLSDSAALLSPARLRLIASMFAQMCDAVAACHDQRVFHRDIKPENFIVHEGVVPVGKSSASVGDVDDEAGSDEDEDGVRGRRGRNMNMNVQKRTMMKKPRVIVKLTDFGLATTDERSSDMDCGSAPYMSFECRNNVAPTYSPRAADVWSLGIVLINMLYHQNPWTDTAVGSCSSFSQYRAAPVTFLTTRLPGLPRTAAEFLASRVFCVLPEGTPGDHPMRIDARGFKRWVREMPALFAAEQLRVQQQAQLQLQQQQAQAQASRPVAHRRQTSLVQHALAAGGPPSHRPSSRAGTPLLTARGLPSPSIGPSSTSAVAAAVAAAAATQPIIPVSRAPSVTVISRAPSVTFISRAPSATRPVSRVPSLSPAAAARPVSAGGSRSPSVSMVASSRPASLVAVAAAAAAAAGVGGVSAASVNGALAGAANAATPTSTSTPTTARPPSTSVLGLFDIPPGEILVEDPEAEARYEEREQKRRFGRAALENEPFDLSVVHEQEHQQEEEEEEEEEQPQQSAREREDEDEVDEDEQHQQDHEHGADDARSRSQSNTKRRKRGLRRGKGGAGSATPTVASAVIPPLMSSSPAMPVSAGPHSAPLLPVATPSAVYSYHQAQAQAAAAQAQQQLRSPHDETLDHLATASQALARELSRASAASGSAASRGRAATVSSAVTASSVMSTSSRAPSSIISNSSSSGRAHVYHYQPHSHQQQQQVVQQQQQQQQQGRAPPSPPSLFPIPHPYVPKDSSSRSLLSPPPVPPLPPVPSLSMSSSVSSTTSSSAAPSVVAKKPSKWKLSFGRNAGSGVNSNAAALQPTMEENNVTTMISNESSHSVANSHNSHHTHSSGSSGGGSAHSKPQPSATATNVTNLIMGLNATAPNSHSLSASALSSTGAVHKDGSGSAGDRAADHRNRSRSRSRGRDRRPRPPPPAPSSYSNGSGRYEGEPVPALPPHVVGSYGHHSSHYNHHPPTSSSQQQQQQQYYSHPHEQRGVSPTSTRSGRHGALTSSASSVISSSAASSNWRSSMTTNSSAASSSAFTRFSNSSRNSLASTAATSVSAQSWRTTQTKPPGSSTSSSAQRSTKSQFPPDDPRNKMPRNVKYMTGVPYQLTGVPRGQVPDDQVRNDAQPPLRKSRPRKSNGSSGNNSHNNNNLEAISERAASGPQFGGTGAMQQPHYQTVRSSVEAASMVSASENAEEDDDERRRVQKGQINTLAKMLSALRR